MKRLIWLITIAGLLFLIAFGVLYGINMNYGKKAASKPSDVILVLGAAVWDGKPSPILRERLNAALTAYEDGKAKHFIVSGGIGKGEVDLSEAEVMKRYLVTKGVPEENIYLEEKATATYENLKFAKEIMEKEGLKTVIIATDRFHMLRTSFYANSLDMTYSFEPSRVTTKRETYYTLREVAGTMLYFIGYK